jgi:hypothetical protein
MVRNSCRTNEFVLDGFPDVAKIVNQLKPSSSGQYTGQVAYTVCSAFPDGSLVIPDVAMQQWRKSTFEEKAQDLQVQHDRKYNVQRHKMETQDGPNSAKKARESQASEQVGNVEVLDETEIKSVDDFVKKITDGERLTVEGGEFLSSGETGRLWVASGASALTSSSRSMCFSFGSGTWEESSEAKQLMDDPQQPWLAFVVEANTPIMFEIDPKSTTVDSNLKEFAQKHTSTIFEMGKMLIDLEGLGEANLRLV